MVVTFDGTVEEDAVTGGTVEEDAVTGGTAEPPRVEAACLLLHPTVDASTTTHATATFIEGEFNFS